MQHYVETKLVEQKTEKWIAMDGKEFNNVDECATYERRKNEERVVKDFKKLKPKLITCPLVDYFYGDNEIYSVNLKDEGDFIVVEDYFAIKSTWMDFEGLLSKKPTTYPCNVLIVSGCEWVDIWGTETELKAKMQDLVSKLI